MRWLCITIALTLVTASAASGATPTAGGTPTSFVISVKSVTTASIPYDKAPAGSSKGDRLLLRDRLLNATRQFGKPADAVVGRDEGVLVLTSATAATFSGVATLPGGTIRVRGAVLLRSSPIRSLPVVGGTGRYAHARGTLRFGKGSTPLNTYHLRLPAAAGVTTLGA
jgi:hypothetical protein